MEVRSSTATLVGRARELERLDDVLAAAAAGRGSTVLISGEAGIGKTRLAAELAARARATGATVLVGRCIDLVGASLPYLPVAEALRPLADAPPALRDFPPRPSAGDGEEETQLRLFEDVLAALEGASLAAPVVLVLEDLHWADASTLDLVAFLGHAVAEIGVVLVGTLRSDEPASRRMLRAEVEVIELGPLSRDEVEALLETDAGEHLPADLTSAIHARSEGNPFFAQELLASAARGETQLPHLLRDALLRRLARLDSTARGVLRITAAAGHDVTHGLVSAAAGLPRDRLLEALRAAVDEEILVADHAASSFRFRHALLAEAVYATLLPGEREAVHARLAGALAADPRLAGRGAASAELAHHWTVAGRWPEALAASVAAARDAEAASGPAEALRHLERALDLWERVPDAPTNAGVSLDAVLARAAELSDLTGNARRAAQLARGAIEAIGGGDPSRAGLLHERLGSYLLAQGREEGLAAFARAVDLVPAEPPSAERVRVLAAFGHALTFDKRYAESLRLCEQAIAAADALGDDRPALRARTIAGFDLCHLGRADEGMERLLDARRRIERLGTARELTHTYLMLCDVLIATGRLRDAARNALEGIDVARRLGHERSYGIGLAVKAAMAFVATGDWDRADEVLAPATRLGGTFWPHHVEMLYAELALARGDLEGARRHLDAAAPGPDTARPFSAAKYASLVAELAVWEGRVDDAARAVDDALAAASPDEQPRLYALALRIEADRAQLSTVRRDMPAAGAARSRAEKLLADARAAATAAARVSPEAPAWRRLAEAEFGRLEQPSAQAWHDAASAFDALERPYVAAYCRWREAEAQVAAGAPRGTAGAPAREAHDVARRLRARLLQRQLELLAQRARLYIAEPSESERAETLSLLTSELGLTRREAEVLELVARGYTNREIGESLFLSVKTASVHVTNILRKLRVSSRVEAAAAAHRITGSAG